MVAKIVQRSVILGFVVFLTACATQTSHQISELMRREPEPPVVDAPEDGRQADALAASESEIAESGRATLKAAEHGTEAVSDYLDEAADEVPKLAEDAQPDARAEVVILLQKEALRLQSEGRWPEAELKLERALRLDGEKLDLYHQLATIRMGQQKFEQAEHIALKGLTLAGDEATARADLWAVIAQCRSAQGNISGAQEARAEMSAWMSHEAR